MNIKNEKIQKIYYMISPIITFILSMILAIIIYKIQYMNEDLIRIPVIYKLLSIILGILIIINAAFYIKKYKNYLEKIFLQIVIPIGICYMVFMIPCQAPDEEGHIFKAYDVSLGHLVTNIENNGNIYVPSQMLDMYKQNLNTYSKVHNFMSLKGDYNNSVDVQTAAKSNSFIGYIATAPVYFLGRLLNINVLLVSYIAKLANFLLYI